MTIKAPAFGNLKKQILGDIAVFTGGLYLTEEKGDKLENTRTEHLGRAKKIQSTMSNMIITEGSGSLFHINARIDDIKATPSDTPYELTKRQERISKLSG